MATQRQSSPMETRENASFALVIVLWAAGLGAAGQFAKISVIFPAIQQVYNGVGPSLGFLVSLISFLGIALGLFAGLIVARIGFRKLLLFALVLGAVLSMLQSSLPSLPLMLASRVLEGVSHLVIVVAAPTLMAQVSVPKYRTLSMTLWSTFFGVSFAIVAWLGIPLVAEHGVGSLFIAHAVFMAFVAALLFFMLPSSMVSATQNTRLGLTEILARHVQIYRSPSEAAPALGWVFYTLTFVSLLTILPGFVAPEHRALVTGAMPLAGIATSITLGVLLLRYFTAVQVIMSGFGMAILGTLLILAFPMNPWLYIALVGALGLVQGASFAAIPQLNASPQAQAHANGAMAQMGNLGNTFGTPLLLVLITAYGQKGMIGFLLVCYSLGLLVHVMQEKRRNILG